MHAGVARCAILEEIMNQSRSFPCPPQRYEKLLSAIQDWLVNEKFECQRLKTEGGGQLLQIQKMGGWRKAVGMSTALNIVFRQVENTVNVEIGAGRWIDKAVVGTVSFFILWPLAFTAAFGAWEQMKMPSRVFDRVGQYLSQPDVAG
jgi:hypothetical protein